MTCGFCFGVGLHECCRTSGCWNRSTPQPTSEEERREEALQAAGAMYAQDTVARMQAAKESAEDNGHEAMIAVLKDRYPGVLGDD